MPLDTCVLMGDPPPHFGQLGPKALVDLWKLSDPMPGVFDNHNGAPCQSVRAFGNHGGKPLNHKWGSGISQTEQYNSNLAPFGKRDYLAKVEIKCHHHTGLGDRLFEDSTVG